MTLINRPILKGLQGVWGIWGEKPQAIKGILLVFIFGPGFLLTTNKKVDLHLCY